MVNEEMMRIFGIPRYLRVEQGVSHQLPIPFPPSARRRLAIGSRSIDLLYSGYSIGQIESVGTSTVPAASVSG